MAVTLALAFHSLSHRSINPQSRETTVPLKQRFGRLPCSPALKRSPRATSVAKGGFEASGMAAVTPPGRKGRSYRSKALR